MRILVTGCRGTLGGPLVSELRHRGHEVWGVDLTHSPDPRFMRADIVSYRQLERAFDQEFDYVYHLAAEFGRINGEEFYETLWQTNVIGTRNILEIQRQRKFRLIFASSSEIYGDKHGELLSEDIPLQKSIIQQNDYAITKWVNEIQIMNFEQRFGNECMRLRFFNAYGPGEYYHNYRSVVCLFCYRALFGIPFTVYKDYRRVFMYVDDFIPTLANAVEAFRPGEVYNIGGREYRSVEELSEIVLEYVGASRSLARHVPQDEHNVRNKRPDIERASRDFGHAPKVALEEGVPRTLDWMRTVYDSSGEVKGSQPAGPHSGSTIRSSQGS
jgi:dTDP-glucose 4,6-dehydratase